VILSAKWVRSGEHMPLGLFAENQMDDWQQALRTL